MRGKKVRMHLDILMLESEYEEFIRAYKTTVCRSKTSYATKLLLSKPVTVLYRNRSLDDFIESAVQLRKELKPIVSKDSLSNLEKNELHGKLDSIEKKLIKIVELCSQK